MNPIIKTINDFITQENVQEVSNSECVAVLDSFADSLRSQIDYLSSSKEKLRFLSQVYAELTILQGVDTLHTYETKKKRRAFAN